MHDAESGPGEQQVGSPRPVGVQLSARLPGPAPIPPLVPGAIRRTMTFDVLRPAGPEGRVALVGTGRDRLPGQDGIIVDFAAASFEIVADDTSGGGISSIRTDPPHDLDGLLGRSPMSGFRAGLDRVAPGLRGSGQLISALLDEVPAAALVALYGQLRAGLPKERRSDRGTTSLLDICAGWTTGGALHRHVERTGDIPVLCDAVVGHDHRATPPAWHDEPDHPPGTVRRRRLIEVGAPSAGVLVLHTHFRDSFREQDGTEVAFHEWLLTAEVSVASLRLVTVRAEPRVLPGTECPSARGSASALVGRSLDEVRHTVASLPALATCTHLNDTMRSLADAHPLVEQVARPTKML